MSRKLISEKPKKPVLPEEPNKPLLLDPQPNKSLIKGISLLKLSNMNHPKF